MQDAMVLVLHSKCTQFLKTLSLDILKSSCNGAFQLEGADWHSKLQTILHDVKFFYHEASNVVINDLYIHSNAATNTYYHLMQCKPSCTNTATENDRSLVECLWLMIQQIINDKAKQTSNFGL